MSEHRRTGKLCKATVFACLHPPLYFPPLLLPATSLSKRIEPHKDWQPACLFFVSSGLYLWLVVSEHFSLLCFIAASFRFCASQLRHSPALTSTCRHSYLGLGWATKKLVPLLCLVFFVYRRDTGRLDYGGKEQIQNSQKSSAQKEWGYRIPR